MVKWQSWAVMAKGFFAEWQKTSSMLLLERSQVAEFVLKRQNWGPI
jgi:hypothetical protein